MHSTPEVVCCFNQPALSLHITSSTVSPYIICSWSQIAKLTSLLYFKSMLQSQNSHVIILILFACFYLLSHYGLGISAGNVRSPDIWQKIVWWYHLIFNHILQLKCVSWFHFFIHFVRILDPIVPHYLSIIYNHYLVCFLKFWSLSYRNQKAKTELIPYREIFMDYTEGLCIACSSVGSFFLLYH